MEDTKEEKITWFNLMWSNNYIQLFAVAAILIVVTVSQMDAFYDESSFYIAMAIPVMMMVIIGYKGFFQFWKDFNALNAKKKKDPIL